MKITTKTLLFALSGVLTSGPALAQDEEDGPGIVPVETYACKYLEGKGPGDLDGWVAKWSKWIDSQSVAYSAWTLTPYYFGPQQDFDFIWLGVATTGQELGRGQDLWLSNPQNLAGELAGIAACNGHANFATMNVKRPPDAEEAGSFVLSFSNCTKNDEKSWEEAGTALRAWGDYRAAHGSDAGMWIMWPAYGGGGAEFDFKFAVSHPNMESLGADYDQYGKEGYKKSGELLKGVTDCDDARTYIASLRHDGMPSE